MAVDTRGAVLYKYRAFEDGGVAQSVEQTAHIRCVEGSIPPAATGKQGKAAIWRPFLSFPAPHGEPMTSTAWMESKYDETYAETLRSLERRRAEDPSFTLEDARGVLSHLYVNDGNNWVGRGELQDIILRAIIDAHEGFIMTWES
jgi:hypothetical protein